MKKLKIGFIGQGYIGKNYADDFEDRGFDVVRYALEKPYNKNGEAIGICDIVFIAVPTPTTSNGFDSSIIKKVIKLVGRDKIVVIKSTILPGTTNEIQSENPDIFLMHSPEFLTAINAKNDAKKPKRNIIGIPNESDEFYKKAKLVMSVLPRAPFDLICPVKEAEFIKYGGNCFLYTKIVFMNLFYDLVKAEKCDWEIIKKAMVVDERIGSSHMDPVHFSGRGAGGYCFIKDFAAFSYFYKKLIKDENGVRVLESLEEKNKDLLKQSSKDLDLLASIYGDV